MDEKRFRTFLEESLQKSQQTVDSTEIVRIMETVNEFNRFLKEGEITKAGENATTQDANDFAKYLILNKRNTRDAFIALIRYSYFLENQAMQVALLELLDGHQVMHNLAEEIEEALGTQRRDEIFEGIDLPPLGTHSSDLPVTTQKIMERLETKVDAETCKELLASGLHRLSKDYLASIRKEFLESENIDDFLKKRHQGFIELLERHMNKNTLFFTQEIDRDVLDFVRQNPQISTGVRKGDVVYVTKIPYMASKYLKEIDERLKKYYYCHCMWVRETILKGEPEISPTFCYCSAGFTKQIWDAALDQPLRVEVVESILQGDLVCTFAVYLPKDMIAQVGK